MQTIHAIFEGGVFKPIEPVELPENCEVEFEPRINESGKSSGDAISDDLSAFVGTVKLPMDGLEYQRRIREEWT